MTSLLLALALQSGGQSRLTAIPDSDLPLAPARELKGAKIISRSGFTLPKKPGMVGRVFRYTVHEKLETFLKRLQKTRSAKDGWHVERNGGHVMFTRDLPQGRLAMQSFVLQKARIVPDPKGRVGIRVIPDPEWTWISYNEYWRN